MSKPMISIDKINAAYAEHVLGWMAVGQRTEYRGGSQSKVYQGYPDRESSVRDVPNAWHYDHHATQAFDVLKGVDITITRDAGIWMCRVLSYEGHPISVTDTVFRHALVRCLLKAFGYGDPCPPEEPTDESGNG